MKKTVFLMLGFSLLAAACNSQTAVNNPNQTQSSHDKKSIIHSDVKKVADFATFKIIAELYFEKYGKYPKSEGNTPEARWKSFDTAIVGAGLLSTVGQDERQKETGFSYDYQTSPNQDQAVLKATLEAPNDVDVKRAVDSNNDLDGNFWGIDCNDPQYCVSLVHRK